MALALFLSPRGGRAGCFYFNSATFELRVTKLEVLTLARAAVCSVTVKRSFLGREEKRRSKGIALWIPRQPPGAAEGALGQPSELTQLPGRL